MRQTQLIEFKNKKSNILRGILVTSEKIEKAILMCGGFERSTTTEKKFKILADELTNKNIASLRFDYSGCGLSDGDFSKTTIQGMANDFKNAIKMLKRKTNCNNISVITHSLSACVVANLTKKLLFEKIVLIAPALNQKNLLRYWFVISTMKKENPSMDITWQNFKDFLDEKKFQNDCKRTDKLAKTNYISANYFLENKEKDYSILLANNQNILHIHSNKDDKVPLESLNIKFKNRIIIQKGDHDLEKPNIIEQWLTKVINFINF